MLLSDVRNTKVSPYETSKNPKIFFSPSFLMALVRCALVCGLFVVGALCMAWPCKFTDSNGYSYDFTNVNWNPTIGSRGWWFLSYSVILCLGFSDWLVFFDLIGIMFQWIPQAWTFITGNSVNQQQYEIFFFFFFFFWNFFFFFFIFFFFFFFLIWKFLCVCS